MGNQEELLLPVLNLIVQIPLVLALSVLWYTFIFTPFGVQEYVRTSLSQKKPFIMKSFFMARRYDFTVKESITLNLYSLILHSKQILQHHIITDLIL